MINIKSFLSITEDKDTDLIESFLKMHDLGYDYKRQKGMGIHEVESLVSLLNKIVGSLSKHQQNGYFIGYTIKRGIKEEFDILRFSEKSILNIELKSQLPKTGYEGIENQLRRHKYFLDLIGKETHVFSYISDQEKIYTLDDSLELIEIEVEELIESIDQDYNERIELEDLNLTDMIISPYSQPEQFSERKYFLTEEQMNIKNKILSSKQNRICLIGGPGTGKSLLLFDVAQQYKKKGYNVLIVFCSLMSDIEALYISRNLNIKVTPIKFFLYETIGDYDVVLLDEAQRLRDAQYEFFNSVDTCRIIFSVDHKQTLHPEEDKMCIEERLLEDKNVDSFQLKDKIRSDEAMSSFIRKLMNLKAKGVQPFSYENVRTLYFNNNEEALEYIDFMCKEKNFISIEETEYTTKTYRNLKRKNIYYNSYSTHEVIGREFDNVIVPLDEYFKYNDDARLVSKYSDYYPYLEERLIFQALTRVKDKLIIVVINNPILYQQIQEIHTWLIEKVQND